MKAKLILKIITNISMTVFLLLLMAYSLVGEDFHEWIGIGMFILFILHHILNNKWSQSLFKGKYMPYRIFQTVLVFFAFTSMLGSMVSGIILSRHVFSFLSITGGQSWARTLHMLSAYWGFIFISLHLGLHWGVMLGMIKRIFKKSSKIRVWIIRAIGTMIAIYGIFSFVKREIGSYMLMKFYFVFFDFDEPLIFFLLDYVAVMGLFVFVGHYFAVVLRRIGRNRKSNI